MSIEKEEKLKCNWVSRRDFLRTSALTTASIAATGMMGLSWPRPLFAKPVSDTINVAMSSDIDTYDVHPSKAGNSKAIVFHVYEALFDRNYQPLLATSYENPDKLTWIFQLKKGVEFTNGEPFTASVVKFNLDRIKDPKTKARYRGMLKPVESVEILDKHTVKVKTQKPYSVFLYALREMPMMSPKAIKELGKDIARKPVGTGPYITQEWIPNEKHIQEANPHYHGQVPKVKSLVWRPIPEPSTRIVELKAGTADIIDKIPPELTDQLSGKNFEIIKERSDYRMGCKLNCGRPPFDKVEVRQALNYAVNKEEIIEYVLRGAGYLTSGYLGRHHGGGYNPDLKPYPYDPALAKKLLAKAGYPNGVEFEMVTPIGRYLKDKQVVEAVAYQVKEAGFNMKVKALEWGMFVKYAPTDKTNGYFIGSGYNDPQSTIATDVDSRMKAFSWARYHNDEVNRLLDEASETFDIEKRNAIYQSLSKTVWNDSVFLWMFDAQDIYGVNNRVKGFKPRSDAWIFLDKAYLSS